MIKLFCHAYTGGIISLKSTSIIANLWLNEIIFSLRRAHIESLNKRSVSRKCKLSSLLKSPYKGYRQIIRTIVKEYSILRRDAMHLALYSVLFWAEHNFSEDPGIYPDIMYEQFWPYYYRAVALGETGVPRSSLLNVVKLRFNEFDITRRHPSNGSYLYQIPYCDSLYGYMANQFSTSIITNIRLHLIKNISKNLHSEHSEREGRLVNFNPGNMANKAVKGVIEQRTKIESSAELPLICTEFYTSIRHIYYTAFGNLPAEIVTNPEFAYSNTPYLLFFSLSLLWHVSSFHGLNIDFKRWLVLPLSQHGIVHASLSGAPMIYQLIKRCFEAGLPILDSLTMQYDQQLIFQSDFCDGYSTPVLKESLWEELFNIYHVQKKRYREASPFTSKTALDYGISTNGHMVSLLFKTVSVELFPYTPMNDNLPRPISTSQIGKRVNTG
ncbi:MAG: hypothetical protein EXX96DRAFT_534505 [Benjaminiella poitrasii]|nr:MAG: hypothetical protein EXX96DRAFT_534505 [Benjaminiella poitrasii]